MKGYLQRTRDLKDQNSTEEDSVRHNFTKLTEAWGYSHVMEAFSTVLLFSSLILASGECIFGNKKKICKLVDLV